MHPETTPPSDLLDRLLGLGQRLCHALEAGDVAAVERLVDERGTLLEGLKHSALPTEAERPKAEALRAQHRAIEAAAAAHQQRIQAALEALGQVRQARARYARQPNRPPILNKNLSV